MQLNKYKDYTELDFLRDKDFHIWQLFHDEKKAEFWNSIIKEYPDLKSTMDKAILIYANNILLNDYKLSQSEICDRLVLLQEKIKNSKKKKRIRLFTKYSSVAAVIALFIVTLSLILKNSEKNSQDIATFAQSFTGNNDLNSSEAILILSEKNKVVLNNTESSIAYQGDAIKTDESIIDKEEAAPFNQLIIPYGKRSTITFSDGTKAWVNAGSKLTYPTEFTKDKREIYVNGEIYIEVSEDKNRPFVIKTKQLDIQVLGTKFNVTAYESDKTENIVLVSGSVSISSNKENRQIVLKPNQMYSSNENSSVIENVDASFYILWAQGIYQYEKENLISILKRIERYYGINIECEAEISTLKCSGKIDLKDDPNKLLTDLTRALPIKYHQNENNTYIIKENINH